MKVQLIHRFEDINSLENLLSAWQEFLPGKRGRADVQQFAVRLADNIFSLHYDLLYHAYMPGGYEAFNISDPKPRNIHKATVRDRLLHHAIYRLLYPFFDRTFIADTYSCRLGKGVHKAIERFRNFYYKVSRNDTGPCWILKGDIRKFFASIDQPILLEILEEYIGDKNIMLLLKKVIYSFDSGRFGVGLPLGNLTSQLFVNIYMNKFDQFVKHNMRAKYYIRYADDFVILSENKEWLKQTIPLITGFLSVNLKLELHPCKLSIKSINSGSDFLGWVNFTDHRILRTSTKKRMLRKLKQNKGSWQSLDSYLGLLMHGNSKKLKSQIVNLDYKSD